MKAQTVPHKKDPYQGLKRRPNALLGKVVLLVSNDTAILPTLVTQLTQRGADIALVCRRLPRDVVRHVRERVESSGRHLLLVEQTELGYLDANHVVETVTSHLGRLDIFIDLSAPQKNRPFQSNDIHAKSIGPNGPLLHAILEEIA